MPITATIEASYNRSFELYGDLIESIGEGALASKLPGLHSNTMGLQLWCVVGARESFSKAIEANEWSGFSCSLDTTEQKEPVAEALSRSAESVSKVLSSMDSYSDVQNRLIVDLLEHEAAHQGQLIRYLYGLKLSIPDSWKARYALQ
ncbi:MAG: hypothetical protein ACSHX9_02730 [Luteolibacter sp.]